MCRLTCIMRGHIINTYTRTRMPIEIAGQPRSMANGLLVDRCFVDLSEPKDRTGPHISYGLMSKKDTHDITQKRNTRELDQRAEG